jgi:hypothetical protein
VSARVARRLVAVALWLASAAPLAAQEALRADTQDHDLIVTIENPHPVPVTGVSVSVIEASPFVENTRITPSEIAEIAGGGRREVRVRFDIGEVEEEKAEGRIRLQLTATAGMFDDPTPEFTFLVEGARVASCNDAVGAGRDAPETIRVDMGGFVGQAGFDWQMYTIKDRMRLYSDGQLLFDTGCVSGSDRLILDVPGGEQITVEVEPNCEGTRGTAWNFRFTCPVEMTAAGADSSSRRDETQDMLAPGAGRVAGIAPDSPADGDSGAATPDRRDAENPELLAAVREWIAIARPPQNAEPGYRLTYTRWGQAVGTTPSGTITAVAAPDDAAGMTYDVFLWTRRPDLASLDHCTLSVYVRHRLNDEPVAHCRRARGDEPGSRPPVLPGPVAVTESDGNNTVSGATPIPGNADITGQILPGGDQDHYVFDAPHHGEWTIAIAATPPAVALALGAYPHPSGGWLLDRAPDDAGRLVVDLPQPGKYVLRVNAKESAMRSVEPYRLAARFRTSPDMHEPNANVAQATPIEGSWTIVGTILPAGDQDHFVFDAPHHGEWTIAIDTAPPGVELALGAYPHPSGGWLPDRARDDADRLVVDLPQPGKYVLRVNAKESAMRSVEPYRLALRFIASPDEFEPNANVAQATPIEGTRTIVGTILPAGDQDHFVFDAPRAGEWTIVIIEEPEGVALNLGAYPHPSGGWLADRARDAEDRLVVDVPKPGKYVLRVNAKESAMRSIRPYRLTVQFR